ncbi:MAG: glycosyltransferase family 4 protein [Caldilineaceae bacterium]|nr:glycosyltransferase family 4 protein [Caldilineaceae bacterium]
MPTPPPIPITIDAGPAVHQHAGLSRYATRLIEHLWREQRDRADLTLFYNAHSGHTLPPGLQAIPARTLDQGQYRWRLGAFAGQKLGLPRYGRAILGEEPRGLYHATEHLLPRLPVPTLLTVHDLIFERYPEHHTRTNRAFLHQAMPAFVRAASHVIAVSEQTRRDLMEFYKTPPEKITVIYEGIDAGFAPAPADEVARVRAAYSPDRPYLLMVGTLEPRKNHLTAVRSLARLKAAGYPHRLLVVGGKGWLFDEIQARIGALNLEDDVRFTGYAPDADLPPLYSGAAAVLLPSLYEGFGFPVLEAMACGAPVACSNASSLPEVAGDAALLVPPTDDEALAAAVGRLLDDGELAAGLVAAGKRQAARFTWSRCAAETAALYELVNRER